MSDLAKKSYSQILRSSVLIGSSAVVTNGLGMVRAKAMAILLGPAGFGLLGMFWTISELARSIAGLGINSSGVRQIAEAVGTGDNQRIARTVTTLRRVAVIAGALGGLLLLALCLPVSKFTFGSNKFAGSVALLSLSVFFTAVSGGQGALVQGMRRIGDLARMNVLGALYGTVFSIVIVYLYKRHGAAEHGLAPALVCVGVMSIVTSWWYSRKIKVERVTLSAADVTHEARDLLKLGVVFMASGLMTMGALYLVRTIVFRQLGFEAAGYYQAAWTIGGLYVGFILQSMGADFYPRLTVAVNDHAECNRLVNEQTEVSLLLAGPGVLATLTFAPFVIQLFYSAAFEQAVEILRWICLGMLMRVASWPMGFIMLAKGNRRLFFWTEFAVNVIYIGLVWFAVRFYGLIGAGGAFATLYLLHWAGMYVIVRRITGYRCSSANLRITIFISIMVAIVFGSCYLLPPLAATALGTAFTIAAGLYSLKAMCTLIPLERLPRIARKILGKLKLVPTETPVSSPL